jgi:hypothetical protein
MPEVHLPVKVEVRVAKNSVLYRRKASFNEMWTNEVVVYHSAPNVQIKSVLKVTFNHGMWILTLQLVEICVGGDAETCR